MQLLPGVGPASAQRVLDHIAAAADPISALADAPAPPRVGATTGTAFVRSSGRPRRGNAGWPAELERARLWYEPHLERIHEDADVRRADLLQLEQIAAGYPSRERFLTELTLDPPDATSDQAGVPLLDEDYLILSTIHSAKGQEWKSVFVLNVVDGCMPSDLGTGTTAEIEEERRLLYVAMTRAKDDLHILLPQRFFTHGQPAMATAMSMPREPGSFRKGCSISSRRYRGRSRHRPPRPSAPLSRHGSISPSGCAGCGAEAYRLRRMPTRARMWEAVPTAGWPGADTRPQPERSSPKVPGRLGRRFKPLEAHSEAITVRTVLIAPWEAQRSSLKSFDRFQHRSVFLGEQSFRDV